MSVRKNQNQVEELRAQIEACAVVARQQAQAIDQPVKAHEYFFQGLYDDWLNHCHAFYIWLKEQDVPKNVNCHTGVPLMQGQEYIDCADDGYRMMKNITTADHVEHANYEVNAWTYISKDEEDMSRRLEILQSMKDADRIFCMDCKTCAFTPNITQDFITAWFYKPAVILNAKRDRGANEKQNKEPGEQTRRSIDEIDKAYTNWLIQSAEYVYIPPVGKGFIFCNEIDSQDIATHHGLQWNGLPYLYVELLCAKEQTSGKILLAEAHKLASFLKLSHIVLSSLGHVIFYYHDKCEFWLANRKFQFVPLESRWKRPQGTPYLIPISETTKKEWKRDYEREVKDKKNKKMRLKLAGIEQNFMQSA